MESVYNLKHSERQKRMNEWLKNSCGFSSLDFEALPYDASFRRYYRLNKNQQSYILMDAPPPERCAPFVKIADALRAQALQTPIVFHADFENGFLLLSDFGDKTYLKTLDSKNADLLYHRALDALSVLQNVREEGVPDFTGDFMRQEWSWHKEWFLQKLFRLDLSAHEKSLDACFELLIAEALKQPQVFMHRDYHSANLMVLPHNNPGILDFQDAFMGPVTYDLASLLRDCYIAWPQAQVQTWVHYYWQLLSKRGVVQVDVSEFTRWFDWMGLERHIKALFTFARKKIRDDQAQYLQHLPRVLNYIVTISGKYPELKNLHDYYNNQVMPCVR